MSLSLENPQRIIVIIPTLTQSVLTTQHVASSRTQAERKETPHSSIVRMFAFEDAAKRLQKDQQKIRKGRKELVTSQKAKREAEFRRKQQERLREEREQKRRESIYQQEYLNRCERNLAVKRLSSNLLPTSIWGEGDKIALPPSLLEKLTAEMMQGDGGGTNSGGNPWIFRIGILNPDYQAPASLLVQTMKPPIDEDDDDFDEDDEDSGESSQEAYLDELSHKYLCYTHCTVVEFTQEEGHVGIPRPVAEALLDPQRRRSEHVSVEIPTTCTRDPAGVSPSTEIYDADDGSGDTKMAEVALQNTEGEKTPGHLAWGAFDIPEMGIEVSLVKLPRGKGCTLVPTKEAIRNGFYGLKDVKLVLEQSLIRTRATLGVGDTVSTWHRGIEYDLRVTKVLPSTVQAVTCINTDIEVDIGEAEEQESTDSLMYAATNSAENADGASDSPAHTGGHTLGGTSISTTMPSTSQTSASMGPPTLLEQDLLPEPPQDQKEGICTVQISSSGKTGRRRFDVTVATMNDLFAFAAFIAGLSMDSFQLVTRFPRTVYSRDGKSGGDHQSRTLQAAGIGQGREAFMVEPLS